MFGKRTLRVAAVAAAVALPLSVAVASPALAADPKPAKVSVFHGIPNLTVDVCAGGKVLIPGFTPGTLSKELALPAGSYDLGLQAAVPGIAAGADCAGPFALAATVPVASGKNYTITANVKLTGDPDPTKAIAPALNVFENNIAALGKTKKQSMKNGLGRVTVRHIAAAPPVGIVVAGNPVGALSPLANGESKDTVLKKGTYQVGATVDGVVALGPVDLKVRQGWNVIAYAWGLPSSVPGSAGPQVKYQYVKLNLPKK